MKHLFATAIIAITVSACSEAPHSHADNMHTVETTQNFETTETGLREALNSRDLTLFTVIDHGEGAKSVGQDIGQSKLFIFGNPASGTPLMVADPTLGLHLPMKILVHEDDDMIHLHRADMGHLVEAHGVTDQDQRLAKIDETLDAIMAEAAGN